jgi:hypothetical protein
LYPLHFKFPPLRPSKIVQTLSFFPCCLPPALFFQLRDASLHNGTVASMQENEGFVQVRCAGPKMFGVVFSGAHQEHFVCNNVHADVIAISPQSATCRMHCVLSYVCSIRPLKSTLVSTHLICDPKITQGFACFYVRVGVGAHMY